MKVFREVLIGDLALRFYPSDNGWMCGITNEMMDALELSRRKWVGLTEEDFSAINQSCLTKLQAATSAESVLKEKNT